MPYIFLTKEEVIRFITLAGRDTVNQPIREKLQASIQPRRNFNADFKLEGPDFEGTRAADGIMKALGRIQGHIATGRWGGNVVDSRQTVLGTFHVDWTSKTPDETAPDGQDPGKTPS